MQCLALYDYFSDDPEDLTFNSGQIINILGVEGTDWYIGEYMNAAGIHCSGIFPKNYVKLTLETEENSVKIEESESKPIEVPASVDNHDHSVVSLDSLNEDISEDKKSVKKSFQEILASFDCPKESDVSNVFHKHSYAPKTRICLSNTQISHVRQMDVYNGTNIQKERSSKLTELDTLQLGSLKDRILALKNIKYNHPESVGIHAHSSHSVHENALEEGFEKQEMASESALCGLSPNVCYGSSDVNEARVFHEPKKTNQEKGDKDDTNDEKKISEDLSGNNHSFMEDEFARRAAIRERMAKMSYAGMNMHMALGILQQGSTISKSPPKKISHDNDDDKRQVMVPTFSVPVIPPSPLKKLNKDHQPDQSPKSCAQNTLEEVTTQDNFSEATKHPSLSFHLLTPQKCHNPINVPKNDNSFKDDKEDLEESATYYTPMPIAESYSAFLNKNIEDDSPILNTGITSSIFHGKFSEISEPLKIPQKPLKEPPSIPEHPYSTQLRESYSTSDISLQKHSTPSKPVKPFFTPKSHASKFIHPILPQSDDQLFRAFNALELEPTPNESIENHLLHYDLENELKHTYNTENQSYIDKCKFKAKKDLKTEPACYKNNLSGNDTDDHNVSDDISSTPYVSPRVIQSMTNSNEKNKKNVISDDIFIQGNDAPSFNLQYKSPKHTNYSQSQQNYSDDYFCYSSPASDISDVYKKAHESQSPSEKISIPNQISINERRACCSIDQRNIGYDPFSQVEYIAHNIDLEEDTLWWTRPDSLPSVFRNRKDILLKFFESSHLLKDGSVLITKDIRILFHDYSETHILAVFNKKNPGNVNLKQTHRPSPIKPNQNQLEIAYEKFGLQISNLATQRYGMVVGDGTPFAFVQDIISSIPQALPSTGVRAHGALIYQNRANALTEQRDEIKTGDIVSFRNAKFQGHKGSLHAKYSVDVGKPDHVAVIMEWDGTKRKIKVWEQGRCSKKVTHSSFKLGDLKSGEICVWRVMSKSWVNWDS